MADEVVTIRYQTCRLDIYVPGLPSLPILKLKKLFRLLRDGLRQGWYADTNENAKVTIEAWLTQAAEDAKENWRFASEVFQREYIDPDYHFLRNSKLWRETKRRNNCLMADVKKTKREYDRMEKLKQYFSDIVN